MNSKSFYAAEAEPEEVREAARPRPSAIGARDPSADVVLGGMAELAGSRKAIAGARSTSQKLYRVKGAKKDFDGVAPHPYGARSTKVSAQVELYRNVMKQAGDGKRVGSR